MTAGNAFGQKLLLFTSKSPLGTSIKGVDDIKLGRFQTWKIIETDVDNAKWNRWFGGLSLLLLVLVKIA